MGFQRIDKRDKRCMELGFLLLEQMQMEYSADDIATARGLQFLAVCSF
jgi:hypothetical protein